MAPVSIKAFTVEEDSVLSNTPLHEADDDRDRAVDSSSVTKVERSESWSASDGFDRPPSKRPKLLEQTVIQPPSALRQKGSAPIKAEYLISVEGPSSNIVLDERDDENEQRGKEKRKKSKAKGQNTQRSFGSSKDTISLCSSRVMFAEFSPEICAFGKACKYEHDLRKYLLDGKREDLATFEGKCPNYDARGFCMVGWRCRFVGAHSRERVRDDGRKELILLGNVASKNGLDSKSCDGEPSVVNVVSAQQKIDLKKHRMTTPKADVYTEYLNRNAQQDEPQSLGVSDGSGGVNGDDVYQDSESKDNRARYMEPPFLPSEKRKIFYGVETPVLAPLTTQGNLPFRRLAVELGAQITWSEMAMGMPLVQGEKSEWALLKAHQSEMAPPKYNSKAVGLENYDNAQDFRFGAQIAANKPWLALKTTEILSSLCPKLRAIDLNCGCPIDLVFRQGAGSALLDKHAQLEKILRGMNVVSGEIPITVKIRMGTKDNSPTAQKLMSRLAFGGHEALKMEQGPPGVAAITLHGRSRQQRYTKDADWSYISECAALIRDYNMQTQCQLDTSKEVDSRHLPPSKDGKIYFIGNGDCYSHVDYYEHIDKAQVDSVMVARGALIKPWIFEEIEKGQYLDKSSSERLQYVEKYARYGLENWGSDEIGIGQTRRFLLEWLSFTCRYVPIGLLEHLPPRIQDRPPAYKGRNELETLMASDNYQDWIKISEMFLGPAHKDFRFEPKHKSNSYDGGMSIEAEG